MNKKTIPHDIQAQVNKIVTEFNNNHFDKPEHGYQARFRGRFLYLDRCDLDEPFQVCRLTYQAQIDDWDFAIYRHSKERYDPDEWFFPGSEFVDGTLLGAMKAGLEAYPIMRDTLQGNTLRTLFRGLITRK